MCVYGWVCVCGWVYACRGGVPFCKLRAKKSMKYRSFKGSFCFSHKINKDGGVTHSMMAPLTLLCDILGMIHRTVLGQ